MCVKVCVSALKEKRRKKERDVVCHLEPLNTI